MSELTTVTINGIDLDYNWGDMDVRERYVKAAEAYEKTCVELQAKLDGTDNAAAEIKCFRDMCAATSELFDATFGAGTGEKVFSGKHDLPACLDAIGTLYQSRVAQQEAINEKLRGMGTASA